MKTLHPKVHGGILNIRDKKEHQEAKKALDIKNIDMIVVNLYPFKEVVAKGCTFDEAIENIDIGGPSMIRAAAKNFKYVTVVMDPEDYPRVMEDMKAHNGETTEELRFFLAKKVFFQTSDYDRGHLRLPLSGESLGGKNMRVLVVGSGGREHALVWKLSQSPKMGALFCAPGNGGISRIASCVDIDATDTEGLARVCPEGSVSILSSSDRKARLAAGIVDGFEAAGIPVFGPCEAGSRIETSKVFAKALMEKYGIPTASFQDLRGLRRGLCLS